MEGEGQDLAEALGAASEVLGQALTLYIPSRDGQTDEEFDNQPWVREAADILAHIGKGYTILPPATGGYLKQDGTVVEELVTLVYAYIEPDPFEFALPRLREFLHRMGRETRQEMVVMELAGAGDAAFFRIINYDAPVGKE
jgi:hypothetical protein